MRIGVDVGGTFTDFVAWHPQRGWLRLKQPTSRPDPAQGILDGLKTLLGQPAPGWDLGHGTTIATNTALEGSGARLALITTQGFGDILSLGRGQRQDLYAIQSANRPTRVAPEDCFEVPERLNAQGEVLTPLDQERLETTALEIQRRGITQVAVCLLFSYLNPAHELAVEAALQRLGIQAFLSHRIDPQPKEFERASTTVMQALIAPALTHYIQRLEREINPARLWMVRSNGGVCRPGEAVEKAVGLLLSGPAAGLRGAWEVARSVGLRNFLSLDVGGTSTDVALCQGEIPLVEGGELDGIPFRCPQLDVHTVGAGGGSIAYRDSTGLLCVGPQSAGSQPGPAAYGRGGPVTVSDALLALGRIPEQLAGGTLRLDQKASLDALKSLSDSLKLDPLETAAAILEVAEQSMAQALRYISLERGIDPADFVLMAYGGGGANHAASLAQRLNIRKVLIPARPGLLCAQGALTAPWEDQVQRSWCLPLTPELQANLQAWSDQEVDRLKTRAPSSQVRFQVLCELRYQGQGTPLWLPFRRSMVVNFHQRHQQRFGHCRLEHPLELVSSLLQARCPRPLPKQSRSAPKPGSVHPKRPWSVYWGLPPKALPALRLDGLAEEQSEVGPLRLDSLDTTIWAPPGWKLTCQSGNLWLETVEHEEEHEK